MAAFSDIQRMIKFLYSSVSRRHYLALIIILMTISSSVSADRIVYVAEIITNFEQENAGLVYEEFDSNSDGKIDYLISLNVDGRKEMESLDYNHDGVMDDLYFYLDGIIVRREIDSNFDMKIDAWVYIEEGSYISRYEQDLDFDGNIDKVKVFGGDE